MQKEFYYDSNPRCTIWDNMWTSRTIEQELEACDMERPPREMFLSYLSRQDRIVEAGCGFGKWVIYLHRLGYDILGIDNNELAVSKLKDYDETLKVELGDILDINYPDSSFDAYISMGVVEHFEEGPQAALTEAYRILKPGGLAFVSVPTVNVIRRFYRRPVRNFVYNLIRSAYTLVTGWKKSGTGAFRDAIEMLLPESMKRLMAGGKDRYCHFTEYRYTREEVEGFLRQAGFEILKTMPHDFYDSRDHAIGLSLDFPFLRNLQGEANFKLNPVGKVVSRTLDGISPWIACASVICAARSLKKAAPE